YRRLNAESLSAPSVPANAAAVQQEPEAGYEAENDAETAMAVDAEADDLEFQPVRYGDAGHESYRMEDAESETLFEAASAPPGAAPVAALALPSQGNLIVFPRPLLEPP